MSAPEKCFPPDAVELEIIKASLDGIVQEMQNSLFRTGYSTIVRESQDASCAIMNADGDVVAQHVVLPLHIGSFPACCQAVLRVYSDIVHGDAFLINHPYEGGSPHAPDMCVITPVFADDMLIGFCGSIAHIKATSAARCRDPVPAKRAKSSMRACTCPPSVISVCLLAISRSSASLPAIAVRRSWCSATCAVN